MSAWAGVNSHLTGAVRTWCRERHGRPAVWTLGTAGLIAYNWWVLALLKPGLVRSPDEMFSNLEAIGQPYATAMRATDIAAAVAMLGAFAIAGRGDPAGGRREWLGLVAFALAGLMGGIFPEVCADSISRSCMSAELAFRLPASQYLHDGAGIAEFTAISLTVLLAWRRTRGSTGLPARTYRLVLAGLIAGYPVLGLAYLTDRFDGVVEALFLTAFSAAVLAQLAERAPAMRAPRGPRAPGTGARGRTAVATRRRGSA